MSIVEYMICSNSRAYMTEISLTYNTPQSKQTMPYRNMILDSYHAATGNLNIDFILTDEISNPDALKAMAAAFAAQGKRKLAEGDTATFVKGGKGWKELLAGNPFAQGKIKLVEENKAAMGGARIGSFVVISKKGSDPKKPHVYMVANIVR